jgi:D-arabinose 1-dehydrogenase-like Zn-dependent alcohol dehydrogenase
MMQAMQLDAPGKRLRLVERPLPEPGPGQVRVKITACGVCRTDLHVADGDIHGLLPIIPGHEIVGRIDALGRGVKDFAVGDRVGVPCGLARPAAIARVADHIARICATIRNSPASPAMAALRRIASPNRGFVSPFPRVSTIPMPRRCCAPG